MADIELVVKIPKRVYNYIRKYEHIANIDILDIKDAIINGTPLPKHGRLIDADEFLKENKDYTGWILCSDAWGGENAYKDTLEDLINDAPTIIGAEKEREKE